MSEAILREALEELLHCSNAIVGADVHDERAAEAFEMFNDARLKARAALSRASEKETER